MSKRMSSQRMVSAREIVGKKIVAFRPNGTVEGNGIYRTTMHTPVIVLDDGSELHFMTEEHPDAAYYGTWIGRRLPR